MAILNFKSIQFSPAQMTSAYRIVALLVPNQVPLEDLQGLLAGYSKTTGLQCDILMEVMEPVLAMAGDSLNFELNLQQD